MPSALSRRRFLGGSIALLAGASAMPLLSACGSGDDGGNATEINALLITGGDRYPKYWETVTNAFKQQTGVTVKYDLLQFTPLTSKEITLAAARSTQYDVYSTHTAQIGAFFPHFEPLNNHFSASDLEDFFPVAIKYLTNPANGELAAIPRNMDSRTQYYRTDLYEKSSLRPAKTWDELIDVGQKLTGGGQFGLVLPGQGDPAQRQFADFLWQAGGEWLDDGNNVTFNSPEGVEALTFYRDLIKRYEVVPGDAVTYGWNENSAGFSNGTCAAVFDWPGAYASLGDPSLSKVSDTFATAPLTSHKTAVSCAISHALAINKYSRKKDAAAEFLKFTVTPQALLDQYAEFKNYPSRVSTAEQVIGQAQGKEQQWLTDLRTTIQNGKEWPKVPGFDKVSTVVQTAVQNALSDQMSPKAALDGAAQESTRILQQAGTLR
jgi:ABC-type glycerol-3-phosphate transport system substrate-binding protein